MPNEKNVIDPYVDDHDENVLVEIKVTADQGETWQRRKVDMSSGIEESGLKLGEMFIWQSEKFAVSAGEDGLIAEPLKKPANEKKQTRRR